MQERLGHANVAITLDLYTQVVDELHDDAAAKVASVIYGGNSARP
jgi:integrase